VCNEDMKKLIKIAIGILLVGIIVIATDFYLLWLPLEHSPEYPAKVAALFMAVTALVTLLLALSTVKATEQSNLREKNRRTDEIEREKRDRKERLLNEIIEWAEDVAESALRRQTMEQVTEFYKTTMEYKFSKAKSSYISEIVSISFSDLSPFLKNVIKKLDEAIDIIARYMKIEKQASLSDLRNSEKELTESVEKLIVEAAKIKTKDII